ncbi:AP2 domain-containing protein [Mammaliicoccus sciuri]|uniref:AP2 domain-containing protein n=1 Tax=Mammaliicoccus sciuri TaxID=1296 RepID=UPI002DBAF8BE|nr:AP2 domain-containing protein [Mammaliicoccus sciuri]MEB5757416.1 AP2 domain-containing protein [Mammaliicoccus sciuri]
MVKSIYLQDGEEIFVDDEDYERVNQHMWFKDYSSNNRMIRTLSSKRKTTLSSFIKSNSFQIEKNNRFTKDNLTIKGNKSRWSRPSSNGTSKYKGVHWDKRSNKWCSSISVDGKNVYLGRFESEDEAAKAYNQAVLDYWDGEGYLNKIGTDARKKRDYKTYKNRSRRRDRNGYFGTYLSHKKIGAAINFNNKKYHIGSFENAEKAALAFNKCSVFLFGEDTKVNDVQMTDELKSFISNWEIPKKIKQLKE